METKLKSLSELESYLAENNEGIRMNSSYLVDLKVNQDLIEINLLLSDYTYFSDKNLFLNIWKDARHSFLNLKVTYYIPTVFLNEIDLSVVPQSKMREYRYIDKNILLIELIKTNKDDKLISSDELIFEYESIKFEVIGVKDKQFFDSLSKQN